MTLNEIRELVRYDLHDADNSDYRWTNEELERHIAHAVNELSEAIPLQTTAEIATIKGSREIDISTLSGVIIVQAAEYPVGRFPQSYQRFSVWGNTLTLLGNEIPDGNNIRIYYGKLHELGDTASTIPLHLDELLIAGACGFAAIELSSFAINRVNIGGSNTPHQFLVWGESKLTFFRKELKRMGSKNRIRVNRMYKPYYQTAFKTTGYSP